jgi:hypothetical protein
MTFKGEFMGLSHKMGRTVVTFSFDGDMGQLEGLDGVLTIEVSREKKKRSLDANAYFHVLVNKIAGVVGASITSVKNRLIREYGQYEYIDGHIPTLLVKPEYLDEFLNSEAIHLKQEGMEGDRARMAVMRGSHTYNTEEMAHLIDGAVAEAKDLGIETLPPDEIRRIYGV